MLWSWCGGVGGQVDRVGWSWRWKRKEERSYHDMFFVKKKEGSLHLVQDYWKLNEITIKNSYPLPLVSNMLTRLCDAEWFTTLDLHWGFNNVQLQEGDEWKAAFQTNQGLFEPT